jgi:hypothetical protein
MATRLIGTDSNDPWLPDVVRVRADKAAVADLAGNFTAVTVEGVLAELSDTVADIVVTGGAMPAASDAETVAGTITNKAVTPAGLAAATVEFDVRNYGALVDGVTDDTAAINAAVAAAVPSGGVVVITGNTVVSGTITVSGGVTLAGKVSNHTNATTITSSATSGPVIQITERSCTVRDLHIAATTARRAASTATGHGILAAGPDVPKASAPFLSRLLVENVSIQDQPADGLHTIGSMELSRFENVTVQDCRRHGFVHDGGTLAGYTNAQYPPFVVVWNRCRALECGGQALITQSSGGLACMRLTFNQFEALGCAWDSAQLYGGSLYQVIFGGIGNVLVTPDIEDQQYANATTSGGKTKTARAAPSKGVQDNCTGVTVISPYFSSLSESWNKAPGLYGLTMWWPDVNLGAYSTPQVSAIIIPATCPDIEVHWITTRTAGATQVVKNQSLNARLVVDGIPQIGDAFSTIDFADGIAPVVATLSTDICTSSARRTQVGGQGAAADVMSTLRVASGITGAAGMDMFVYRGAEDITVKHGVGNIRTSTGTDVVMTATENTVLHFACDGTNWVQLGGAPKRAINTNVSAAITAALTDAGAYVRCTASNPVFTVPPNSTVPFPVGTQIDGVGTISAMTIAQGAGVTVNKARTFVTTGAGAGWTLIKVATDTWDLHGDLV